jgi:hypothetical protein
MPDVPEAHWRADLRRLRLTGRIDERTLPGVLALVADCTHAGPVTLDLAEVETSDREVAESLRRAGARALLVIGSRSVD